MIQKLTKKIKKNVIQKIVKKFNKKVKQSVIQHYYKKANSKMVDMVSSIVKEHSLSVMALASGAYLSKESLMHMKDKLTDKVRSRINPSSHQE